MNQSSGAAACPVLEPPQPLFGSDGEKAPPFVRLEHTPALDGLRGLAIGFVVLGHYLEFRMSSPSLQLGPAGVSLFFALSGYLIASLLLAERNRTGRISLRKFYSRRALRIFPASLTFLAFIAAARSWVGREDLPWSSWLVSVLYLRNIRGRGACTGHLWSLSLEEQFYCLWPSVVTRVRKKYLAAWTIAAIIAVITLRSVAATLRPDLVVHGSIIRRPWFRADTILSGCLIAVLLHEEQRGCPRRVLLDFFGRTRS